MVGSADFEDIDKGTFGESDGIFILWIGEVVCWEEVIELAEDGVKLSEVFINDSDELRAGPNVLFLLLYFEVPLDLDEHDVELQFWGF